MSIEPVVQRRWRCSWCRGSFAQRSYAATHEAQCLRSPASQGCGSCAHFTRLPCCAYNSDECGCKGLNGCAVGAFPKWRYNDHDTREPDPDGWWTHTVDYVPRNCPSWAAEATS